MANSKVITIDLNFQGKSQAIASYLIRHENGAVLVESGPGSTLDSLKAGLDREGLSPRDITHVLLTHIHLDHAGAAGWLSHQGAMIHVHPNGAAHMLNPEKLIASATRIYGDQMETLWGEFLPVAAEKLVVPQDGEEISIGNLRFVAVHTPGHAEHHYSYLFEDLCFSGDVGGVRIPGFQYLRAPMPPPELHFGKWRDSIKRLQSLGFSRIAPTHFGIFDDASWQLSELQKQLDATEKWLEEIMRIQPSVDGLRSNLETWMKDQERVVSLSEDAIRAYSLANPIGMSADGLIRYWKKFRSPSQ